MLLLLRKSMSKLQITHFLNNVARKIALTNPAQTLKP